MPEKAKLMFWFAQANEHMAKLSTWLHDQNLVAHPAHKLLALIMQDVEELYNFANIDYDAKQ